MGLRNGIFLNWYSEEENKSINILNRYEEKGIEKFNDAVKFLYNQFSKIEDKQDFDMEAALQLYEGETGK